MRQVVWLASFAIAQALSAPPSSHVVDEVGTLAEQTDNEGRFDAVTRLLQAHNVPYAIEPFTIPNPVGAEPRTRGRNIVVSIGSGPRAVVLAAHYDAVRLRDGSLGPGAVDNGAASVMLVHVADELRKKPLSNPLRIVWFDMEETGQQGSAHYVEAHRDDGILAMINFDIAGYGDTFLFSHPPGGESLQLRRAFREACARSDNQGMAFPSLPFGDDRSFGKARVPTLTVATLPATQAHQMWLLMNAGAQGNLLPGTVPEIFQLIHTANDVPGKVDADTIVRVESFTTDFALSLLETSSF